MPTGTLPSEGKKLWEQVYDEAKASGDSEETAAQKAWGAVKSAGWTKDDEGKWVKKAQYSEFSLRIEKAAYDKATNERRWRAVASDIDEDIRKDNMSLELFDDFVHRIEEAALAPEEFRSDFWAGGMPYVSVSHYPDLDGSAVPGLIDAVYIDGKYLKAKGRFNDTPLGRACFESVCSSLYGKDDKDKVRISIAFLDWAHKHKSNNFVFERANLEDFCPECLREMQKSEFSGKIYLKGQLVHLALTRVPVNTRTSMEVEKSMAEQIRTREEDAASIVGEDLARELDEKASLVGKSAAVVIKSETEEVVVEEAKTTTKDVKDAANENLSEDEKEATGSDDSEDKKEKKMKEKSEALDVETVRSIVQEAIKAAIPSPTVVHESHPLDGAFTAFKSAYDAQISQEASAEDKLRSIQGAFEDFGREIIASVKAIEPQPTPTAADTANSELVAALSAAIRPLAENIQILNARLAEKGDTIVPQRRSIQPTQEMQQFRSTAQPTNKAKSPTPKLAELIAKTV